jgi:hypothetical protein
MLPFLIMGKETDSGLSVKEVLANLEARVAFHRDKEAFHRDQEAFLAQQMTHHREQQAFHGAEAEKVVQNLEAFRTVVAFEAAQPVPKAVETAGLPPPGRKMVGQLVKVIAESPDLEEPFGPTAVAAETNRRFASRLSKPVGPRPASDVLRRMLAEGRLELVRKGTANREALYKRSRQGGP